MWNKHYLLYLYGIITFALSILQHNFSGSGLLQDISLTLCVFSVPYTIKLRHNKTELSIYRSQAIRSQTTHPFSVFREPAFPSFLSHHSVTDRFWLHVSFSGLRINCIIKKCTKSSRLLTSGSILVNYLTKDRHVTCYVEAHYFECAIPVLSLSHGILTDKSIFRLLFSRNTSVPV